MSIQNDGFTKDPGGSGGGGEAPAGTGFVRVTDGAYDTPAALSATDMIWAVATTTRSTNAFSGDLAVAPASLATGLIITWRVPSAPSGASTYNLNSLGAKDIYVRNAAAGAADLVANRDLTMRYDGTRWQIIAMGTLVPGDLPITGTPGTGKVPTTDGSGGLAYQTPSATDSTKLPLTGGTVSGVLTFGSSNSVAGNAIGRNTFGHTEISSGDLVILTPTNQVYINKPFVLNGTHTALASSLSGEWTDANAYHVQSALGCLVECAKLTTRANSTAYSLCPAPAGDVLRCKLQDGSSKRAVALVDASGTVTFESGSHADYVSGSSPASGEVGVYVTASVLTIKPGSAGTRTIGAIIERARA